MTFGERFLANPDLFPARVSGEVWGDRSLQVNIPCGPFLLTGLSEYQVEAVQQLYGDFCSEPDLEQDPEVLEIRVFRAYAQDVYEKPTAPGPHPIDIDYLPSALKVAGYRFMALLGGQPFTECGIWVLHETAIGTRIVIENVLRIAVAYRLLERGGILLHSAGLLHEGEADIFFGHSGAGKTTISRLGLDRGREVLSDDLNALFVEEGRVFVEKMPFAGELGDIGGAHGRYPVRGVYLLHQGRPSAVDQLPVARAVARLFGSSPFANADLRVTDRAFSNVERIAACAKVARLTFALDEDFWPLLDYNADLTPTPAAPAESAPTLLQENG